MKEKILNVIKEVRERSKKRNFSQTFDLIVNLKEIDVKKPENKFSEDVLLPHGRGKETKVILFSDSIKEAGCEILTSEDIKTLSENKRASKKLANQTDFFLAEPKLMPLIGKTLGIYLGPRGKMPRLVVGDVNTLIKNYKRSVRVRLKDSPVIQCVVGVEDMEDEKIAENILAVLKFLEGRLPRGKVNIKEVLLKLTMSKPVKIGV
ncbi:MAG: 50S ribosomal protein L1 [Candidatus Aenigmarchaeota archaeon]|nr:50S ribosomal protein L1 [Candidatus Aenigmarchaeota archaeon]